ncbi:hypothetical protein JCM3765_003637 [Sporobolomyces pararoseus]
MSHSLSEEQSTAFAEAQHAVTVTVKQEFSDFHKNWHFHTHLMVAALLKAGVLNDEQEKVCKLWEKGFHDLYFGSSCTKEAERWFRDRLNKILRALDMGQSRSFFGGWEINPRLRAEIIRDGRNIQVRCSPNFSRDTSANLLDRALQNEQDFWIVEITELFNDFVEKDIRKGSRVDRDEYISALERLFQLNEHSQKMVHPRVTWLQVYHELLVLTDLVSKRGQEVFPDSWSTSPNPLFKCRAINARMRSWTPPDALLKKQVLESAFLFSTFAISTSLALPAIQVGKPDVDVVVKFPEKNPFGRVMNGVSNNLVNLRVTSHSSDPLKVVSVHSQYFESGGKERPLRQSTNMPLALDLPPRGKSPVIPYRFHSENKIGQVGLRVYVDVLDASRKKWTYLGYEGTVEIVEPAGSWFDLELISLYIILTGFFGSIGYLVYKSYIFAPSTTAGSKPGKKRGPRPNIVAKDSEIRDSAEAVKEGEKVLDQDWIPDHHLRSRNGSKGGKGKEKK